MLRHLYMSRCEVLRLNSRMVHGTPTQTWSKIDAVVDPQLAVPGELMCRLDLTFLRPNIDTPMPIVAGRVNDRTGVMYFDYTTEIKAGDRVRCIDGPVTGTFDIRVVPEPAIDYRGAHHMEIQVIEVSQQLMNVVSGGEVES